MTLNFQRSLFTSLIVSASLTACNTPKGQVKTQELVAANTSKSASNGHWLLLGTQAQGTFAFTDAPFSARFHWHNNKEFPTPVTALAIAANAAIAITASNDRLVIWNTDTGQPAHHLSAPATIKAIAINRDGTLAALALTNNTAVIINLVRGGVIDTFVHQSPVLSIAIDDQYLLTGEEANQAHLWKINEKSPLQSFQHNDGVNMVTFGPADILVTAGRYDATKFWNKKSGALAATISSSAKSMDAGRRALRVVFESETQVIIGYSDSTVERVDLNNAKTLKKWVVSASTPFTKSSASLIGIEQIEGQLYAISSDSRAHRLVE